MKSWQGNWKNKDVHLCMISWQLIKIEIDIYKEAARTKGLKLKMKLLQLFSSTTPTRLMKSS